MTNRYFGRVLNINLGSKEVSVQKLEPDLYQKVIGGKGLAAYLLLRHLARGMRMIALLCATADRGGCHVRGSTLRSELLGLPKPVDRLSYSGKAQLAAGLQSEYALMNSFSICLFDNFALSFDDYAQAASSLFSRRWSAEELRGIGRRIWNLTRLFNCREGFSRRDDTLPARLFFEPLPEGASKGEVVVPEKFQGMLDEYYQVQGWDEEGVPKPDTLARLGVDELLQR